MPSQGERMSGPERARVMHKPVGATRNSLRHKDLRYSPGSLTVGPELLNSSFVRTAGRAEFMGNRGSRATHHTQ